MAKVDAIKVYFCSNVLILNEHASVNVFLYIYSLLFVSYCFLGIVLTLLSLFFFLPLCVCLETHLCVGARG